MGTPLYPSTIPIPKSVQTIAADQLVAGPDDGGPRDVRRRTIVPGAIVSVNFKFLLTEYSQFVEWFKTTLLNGHKWFKMKLPSAGGVIVHVVKFVDRPRAQLQGHRYWDVSAQLEVRERRFESIVWTENFASGLSPYTHSGGGSLADYSVTDGVLSSVASVTYPEPSVITRSMNGVYLAHKFHVEMLWTAPGGTPIDDSCVLVFTMGVGQRFNALLVRETFYDALRRPRIILDTSATVQPGAGMVTEDHWFQLEVEVNEGLGNSTWELLDMDTGSVISGNFPSYNAQTDYVAIDTLMFVIDSNGGSIASKFRNINVYGL